MPQSPKAIRRLQPETLPPSTSCSVRNRTLEIICNDVKNCTRNTSWTSIARWNLNACNMSPRTSPNCAHICIRVLTVLPKKGDRNASSVGKRSILPSSFGGSPRALHAAFQDGIAICNERGKADLLITMAANPNWLEVEAALLPGQKPNDHPDSITRVFKLKLQSLLEDLLNDGYLGRTVGHMYVIEFQKRGLPHAHILVIFAAGYKLLTPEDYDSVICAEIRDKDEDPELYEIIGKCYMHGPCGSLDPKWSCMKDGRCKNRYPREFQDVTTNSENGYPLYCRRNNGRTITCRGHELDNRWVVPHVRALARKYACHINVEYSASLAAIKYLHEYIYKGFDRGEASLRDDQVNEVVEFVEGRYICTSEGVWRLLAFDLHEQFPLVLRLPVHLENQQHVRWKDQQHLTDIVGDGPPDTPLVAWLKSNAKPGHAFGKHLLYTDYAERSRMMQGPKSGNFERKDRTQ